MTFDHLQASVYISAIVGYFAAHAAGFLTKAHAPQWVLGAVTVSLSTLAGVLPTVVWNPGDGWHAYLVNVVAALGMATLGHKSKVPSKLHKSTTGVVG